MHSWFGPNQMLNTKQCSLISGKVKTMIKKLSKLSKPQRKQFKKSFSFLVQDPDPDAEPEPGVGSGSRPGAKALSTTKTDWLRNARG